MTPCQQSVSLGAYLLGALDPEERRAMETHVAGCPHCRAELVELAPLPGLLRHTPFEELEASAQAAESLTPVRGQPQPPSPAPAQQPHRHRIRRGRAAVAAGLTLAAAAAGVLVYQGVSGGGPRPAAVAATWSATDPGTHVSASAAMTAESWGTEFQLKLAGLPWGITCHLVVHAGNATETAGTWGSGYSSGATVPASTSLAPSQITGLDVVSGSGSLLVHLRPGT
ncbi:anti-sigma factor [Streptacidiphilus sp. EB129]|uniref:anti-sigma factor family protein n=1 Tax=Streptacidiphilus sp. EB129 TaxID=3156262 RepID=UPI003517DF47